MQVPQRVYVANHNFLDMVVGEVQGGEQGEAGKAASFELRQIVVGQFQLPEAEHALQLIVAHVADVVEAQVQLLQGLQVRHSKLQLRDLVMGQRNVPQLVPWLHLNGVVVTQQVRGKIQPVEILERAELTPRQLVDEVVLDSQHLKSSQIHETLVKISDLIEAEIQIVELLEPAKGTRVDHFDVISAQIQQGQLEQFDKSKLSQNGYLIVFQIELGDLLRPNKRTWRDPDYFEPQGGQKNLPGRIDRILLLFRYKTSRNTSPMKALGLRISMLLLDISNTRIIFPERSKVLDSMIFRVQLRHLRVSSRWSNLYRVSLKYPGEAFTQVAVKEPRSPYLQFIFSVIVGIAKAQLTVDKTIRSTKAFSI